MGKSKRFYVGAFVIVNLSVTYEETEFWQGSVSVTFSSQLLCVADKYNDQCFDMLLFASVELKIPPSRQMSGWNQTILPEFQTPRYERLLKRGTERARVRKFGNRSFKICKSRRFHGD